MEFYGGLKLAYAQGLQVGRYTSGILLRGVMLRFGIVGFPEEFLDEDLGKFI